MIITESAQLYANLSLHKGLQQAPSWSEQSTGRSALERISLKDSLPPF